MDVAFGKESIDRAEEAYAGFLQRVREKNDATFRAMQDRLAGMFVGLYDSMKQGAPAAAEYILHTFESILVEKLATRLATVLLSATGGATGGAGGILGDLVGGGENLGRSSAQQANFTRRAMRMGW